MQVFWYPLDTKEDPDAKVRPAREALCNVPFLRAREWLCAKGAQLRPGARAWVWDWLDGEWRKLEAKDVYPGQTLLVAADTGGYDLERGWMPLSKETVGTLESPAPTPEEQADASESDEHLSELAGSLITHWQTIAIHGAQVGKEAGTLANTLCPALAPLFDLAGRWHDLGKAHDAFQNSIAHAERPNRRDIAKAPQSAWPKDKLYSMGRGDRRKGFRHELVSTLGLFEVLRRHAPHHQALLGPWEEVLDAMGSKPEVTAAGIPRNPIEQEIIGLSAEEFDLLAYLVCSHHGKVRMAWHASPADQAANDSVVRIRGVREGDRLPATLLTAPDGQFVELPECELTLAPSTLGLSPKTGRAWTDRVLRLLKQQSSFQLGYLEALLRTADVRASKAPVADPLLQDNTGKYDPARSDQSVASPAPGRKGASQVGSDPTESGDEHGVRGRTGQPEEAGGGTRKPATATRFVSTTLGRLSYAQLADHLADRVAAVEVAVEQGAFSFEPIHEDLIVELHRAVCADLVPDFVGWRKVDVTVGTHTPPAFFLVPQLMRQYAADLEARLQSCADSDSLLLEALAYAEGQLLSIHPFADFNGRVTRVFLSLLLIRLDLPAAFLLPSEAEKASYLLALRAADQMDWAPLMEIWRERLSKGATG